MAVVPPDISVVVLTYNNPELLLKCLNSIPDNVEIIVTDDGTEPKLDDILPEKVTSYVWHEHCGCRASTARNTATLRVTRPKVLFLDHDVELHPMALAAHSVALNMYDVSMGLLPREKWFPYTDDRMLFYFRDDEIGGSYCWSGNLAVRSPVFAELDGFDEVFNGGHGFEDLDFGRRAQEAEKRLHLNRLALAHHPATHTAFRGEINDLVLVNQRKYQRKWEEVGVKPVPSQMG